ncbi:MAG: transposase [Oscillospiraceae bacterium]|nr:transposase [Oscillospiraceae bacterium]
MVNYSTLNSNLKRGILRFSEKISKKFSKPDMKFICNMIYGILSSKSCLLSEIARNLNEKISLRKTVTRLSRNLNDFNNGSALFEEYLTTIKNRYTDKSILIIDGSDITKPASTKLEGLCEVRDGSTGEIGIGYHTIGAAVLSDRKLPYGVYSRIYSSREKTFISEDKETINCFEFLSSHFSKSNIRTMDRGYDCNTYYKYFIKNKEKFIIRAKKNRNVIYKDKTVNILDLAKRFKGKYKLEYTDKSGVERNVKISIIPIRLCEFRNTELNLVVVYGFGKTPMMLITNLKSEDKRISVAICKVYLMRWRIEEYFKFKKQSFDFENLRVQSLKSIRNLDLLLTIAIGYIAELSGKSENIKIRAEIIAVSKRLFAVPDFVYYAVADGIFEILKRVSSGISRFFQPKPIDRQLSLFSFDSSRLYFGET